MARLKPRSALQTVSRAPTGIKGLDEITLGGLPKGRPTLVCGSAGSGKTLFAVEFLVRGALQYGEPGVFLSFEENADDLTVNVASLGFDLKELSARKKIILDHIQINQSEFEETGEYDLEGLFVRLGNEIDSIKAKRVVLDTIEVLFSAFSNLSILRSELRRLFRWLKDKGVTAVITAERGNGSLTRHGLEEYISDCVILLDHRIKEQLSTRRIRIIKFRGSVHGGDEYPFLVGRDGISIFPITSLDLEQQSSNQRISSGIPALDTMLEGKGYFRGSSILISGTAGTGKTSLVAHAAEAACRRGERCLYLAFEESQGQIIRNMSSIGIDFEPWVRKGILRFHAVRPTLYGLEMHLATIHRLITDFDPGLVVFDPVSNFTSVGDSPEVYSMLLRLIDYLKVNGVTTMLTNLVSGDRLSEGSEVGISSVMDTLIVLRDVENLNDRIRMLFVLKSRGMAHSRQLREILFTKKGIDLGPSRISHASGEPGPGR
ncbi:MAG TPA: circadian clock protein KaiC [Bacteroidota bacterium]|jgi:circadian clock protein KaiC